MGKADLNIADLDLDIYVVGTNALILFYGYNALQLPIP